MLPGSQDSRDVLDDVLGLEQLIAFGVGLHQSVFNAVVHHFGVVSGTGAAGVDKTVRQFPGRTESLEDGQGPFHIPAVPADHQSVAVVLPVDAAGNPAVEETDTPAAKHRG